MWQLRLPGNGRPVSSALDEVADAADQVADDQRQVARLARAMQRRRDRGWSWARVVDHEDAGGVFGLLRRSGRRLGAASAKFTRAIARELHADGESYRKIARRLGVSHQRVSAMLNDRGSRSLDG